jgi:hypothetical protein
MVHLLSYVIVILLGSFDTVRPPAALQHDQIEARRSTTFQQVNGVACTARSSAGADASSSARACTSLLASVSVLGNDLRTFSLCLTMFWTCVHHPKIS